MYNYAVWEAIVSLLDVVGVRVCKNLKAERIKQDISQQRLSEMAGISRTGIRHLESLETNPTLASLLRVADAPGLDMAKLIKSVSKYPRYWLARGFISLIPKRSSS